jgi:hypothetical protein
MTVHLRLFLIALMVQASLSVALAADATGWVEEDCTSSTFHLTKIDGISIPWEIILRLKCGSYIPLALCLTGTDWWEVQGMRCSADGKCEDATKARIWLDKEKGKIKHVSGKYVGDFNGQHLEGQFVVNYRKHKQPLICE